jgi:hypothetical protein
MYKNPRLSSRFECSNNTDSIHNSLTLLCGARSVQHDAAPRAPQVCVCEQSNKSFFSAALLRVATADEVSGVNAFVSV